MPVQLRECFCDAGVPAWCCWQAGRNALHCAALYGHADIANLLLSHGASINATDSVRCDMACSFSTAVGCVCVCSMCTSYACLLGNCHWAQLENTSLHIAAGLGHVDLCKALLVKGADATLPNAVIGRVVAEDPAVCFCERALHTSPVLCRRNNLHLTSRACLHRRN